MNQKILSLSGETQAGKDTFAEPLLARGWTKLSFASNLKQMCIEIFQLTPYLVNTQAGKQKIFTIKRDFTNQKLNLIIRWMSRTHNLSGCQQIIEDIRRKHISLILRQTGKPKTFKNSREILQFVGTEVCRRIFNEYHLDIVRIQIEKTPGNIVITDTRFLNEREMLQKVFGATLIRIKRPKNITVTTNVQHLSEASLGADEEYDVVFINDGTIKQLHKEAERYL